MTDYTKTPTTIRRKSVLLIKMASLTLKSPAFFVNTNAITLCCVEPVDDNIHNPNPLSAKPVDGNGDVYINLCPACMRKILDNTHLIDENTDAWGSI